MNFDNFINTQPRVINLLNNAIKKNRLVQTYLFEGPIGVNKLDAAYYLSALILCSSEEKPCWECENCKKILNNDNPNIFLVSPVNDMIKKEQIIQLEHEFSMTSLSTDKRIFIIDGIDKCNVQSANSLLKFLEEANDNCYGILLTSSINNVLETIKSRSQIITLKALPESDIYNQLISDGYNPLNSKIASKLCGDLDGAKKILDDENYNEFVEKTIQIIYNYQKELEEYVEFVELISGYIKENKVYANYFIQIFIFFNNELMRYSMNDKKDLIFEEQIKELEEYLLCDYSIYYQEIEILLKYKERLKYNVNVDLLMASMFIELGGING